MTDATIEQAIILLEKFTLAFGLTVFAVIAGCVVAGWVL